MTTSTFSGRHVLITGSSGYFGRELAGAFGAASARLTLADKSGPATGDDARHVQLDVTDHPAIEALVAGWSDADLPDILVNNAAIFPFADVLDAPPEMSRAIFEINVLGPLRLTQLLAQRWMAAGVRGVVVNVSSASAEVARTNGATYGASKAALEQLTRILALRLAESGIRVNAVRPGIAQDPDGKPMPKAHLDSLTAAIPLGRTIAPGELAQAVMFLASEAASFTTGQVLSVDGGGGINRRR